MECPYCSAPYTTRPRRGKAQKLTLGVHITHALKYEQSFPDHGKKVPKELAAHVQRLLANSPGPRR